MAFKFLAVVSAVAAAALTAPGWALAGEHGSTSEWKAPQVTGMPGYKEEPAKPREASLPRPIGQDPYAARNPNVAPKQH